MRKTVHEPLEFEVLAQDLGFPEGPVVTDDGAVFVVDIDAGRVLRLTDGSVAVVATPGGQRVAAAWSSPRRPTAMTTTADVADAFLAGQPDLGPKWVRSFVRVTSELPELASMKIDTQRLRREAWRADHVYWRPGKGEPLRRVDESNRARLDPLLSPSASAC